MTNRKHSFVLGLIFLLLAVVWTWLVIDTIPSGFGEGDIGPRAFPLFFGIVLGALSLLLLAQNFRAARGPARKIAPHQIEEESDHVHWTGAALLLVEISLYGFLLGKVGFVIATPVVVLLVMLVNLRVRSVKSLLGMPLGITLVSWVIFEKVLGIYLANGTWINLG
ncbi:MAG: tripartite tricarboxylate transporter TctB family protein [Halocynthiibacter sp.]